MSREMNEFTRLTAALGLSLEGLGPFAAKGVKTSLTKERMRQLVESEDRKERGRAALALLEAGEAAGFKEAQLLVLASVLGPSWQGPLAVASLRRRGDSASLAVVDLLEGRVVRG